MGTHVYKLIMHNRYLVYNLQQRVRVPDLHIASIIPLGIKFSLSSTYCTIEVHWPVVNTHIYYVVFKIITQFSTLCII